jgi:O-antigen/teichoic acid export membrane protein
MVDFRERPAARPPGGDGGAGVPQRQGMAPPGRDAGRPPGQPLPPAVVPPGWDTGRRRVPATRPPGGRPRTGPPGRPGMARPVKQPEPSRLLPLGILERIWQKNKDLLSNAISLFASTVINSVLGFGFWAVAAREFTTSEVGFGSAAISAMSVLSIIGMFGLNTLLIGELPKRRSKGGLISAALLTAAAGSFILGLGFALAARLFGKSFANISSDPQQFVVFVVGVTVIGMTLVFDEATIGLLRGRLQLWRNFIFVMTKLMLLPVAAFFMHDKFGAGIVASWVGGAVISMGIMVLQLLVRREHVFPKPDWRSLRALSGLTFIHNWLNLAVSVPWMILPVLVTITVGPSANAAFYVAWMLSAFLRVIPIHLATVLFAVASENMESLAPKLRFSLRTSMLIGIPAVVVLCAGSPFILSLFGASYARTGTISVILLSIGYLPSVPKVHYIAVCRAQGLMSRAATVLSLTAILELVGAIIGGKEGGLTGFGLGLLAASLLEGIITAPSVLRAARASGRHRQAHRWVEIDRGQSRYRRYRKEYI